jgi:hypothetical protein
MIWGSNPGRGKRFSLLQNAETGSGVYPASYSMGTRSSFSGGKAAGHETDHSPPPSTKVKNECSDNSTPHTCLHGMQDQVYLFKETEWEVVDWIHPAQNNDQ